MKIRLDDNDIEIAKFNNDYHSIAELLIWCSKNNCSDLFIKTGERPYVNRFGRIILLNVQPIDQTAWDEFANKYISSEQNTIYVRNKMFDFSLVLEDFRYRVNISYSEGQNILTARMINPVPPKFVEYGGSIEYPEGAKECIKKALTDRRGGGMIVFAAPTGSGKTTTMGACINSWGNGNECLKNTNMITLEDPIEYIYNSKDSFRIVQKELGIDFLSFELAIKSAMREHPNIILIGETRDKETIKASIESARTGHIVVSTFHTKDIPTTITRYIDNLSDSMSEAIDLISNLSLIVCQRLEPKEDGEGYNLFVEYCSFDYKLKMDLCEGIRKGESLEKIINNFMDLHNNDPFVCGRY